MTNLAAPADIPSEARDAGITIERDSHTQEFVIVHNRVARDKRLRRADRGLLIEILSLPKDTRLTFAKLLECGPERRDAVRGMINRLVAAGYAVKKTDHDPQTGRWTTRYKFFETPRTVQENPSRVSPAETSETPGQARDGFSGPENPSPIKDAKAKNNNHHQRRAAEAEDTGSAHEPAVPDDDFVGMIREKIKITRELNITDADARLLVTAWHKRAGLPDGTVKGARWYETCIANEPDILGLLPTRPVAVRPPRGACGECDPRTAWCIDENGYPDPARPCPTCSPRTARRGPQPISRPELPDEEIMQPIRATLGARWAIVA